MQFLAGVSGLAFTTADTDYYRAQQRIVRTAVDQAQVAWHQLDATDAFGSWTQQVRPSVVENREHAQESAAALAPLYIAAPLAAVRAVSAPVTVLLAAAFARFARERAAARAAAGLRVPALPEGRGRGDTAERGPRDRACPAADLRQRSAVGHRLYSLYQLRLAARVRGLLDEGIGLDAACRIVTLEDQLDEARSSNTQAPPPRPPGEPYPPLRGV